MDKRRRFFSYSMQKEDFYKGVKTVGFVLFIPFMLAAGPLSGYWAGSFLKERLNLSSACVFLGVVVGFIAACTEVTRLIRSIAKVNKR
ncbi:MAG: hypothetical protein PHN16_00290 [Candidatus Omnitrophica bacterium]|nr:hypothetical protein [Candidatus Omnitrophota bacterium]